MAFPALAALLPALMSGGAAAAGGGAAAGGAAAGGGGALAALMGSGGGMASPMGGLMGMTSLGGGAQAPTTALPQLSAGGVGGGGETANTSAGLSKLGKAGMSLNGIGDIASGIASIVGAKKDRKFKEKQLDLERRKASISQGASNAQLLQALTALLAQRAGRLA